MPQVVRSNQRTPASVRERMKSRLWPLALCGLAIALLSACNVSETDTTLSTPSIAPPSAPPASALSENSAPPTAGPALEVTSEAQAAALVFAANPLFSSITPVSPGLAGGSTSYQAAQSADGYTVSVSIGSGDCQAGCINQHTWSYSVSNGGALKLVSEQGDPAEISAPSPNASPATVTISLVAGPVCPVERNPPDPSCAPRAVPSAAIIVRGPSGKELARQDADANGQAVFTLPGGSYYAESSAVSGLMRQAEATAFSVVGGSVVGFSMEYDTGIR